MKDKCIKRPERTTENFLHFFPSILLVTVITMKNIPLLHALKTIFRIWTKISDIRIAQKNAHYPSKPSKATKLVTPRWKLYEKKECFQLSAGLLKHVNVETATKWMTILGGNLRQLGRCVKKTKKL